MEKGQWEQFFSSCPVLLAMNFSSASVLFLVSLAGLSLAIQLKHDKSGLCVKDSDPKEEQSNYVMVKCGKTATQFTYREGRSDIKDSKRISSTWSGQGGKTKCVFGNDGERNNGVGLVFSGDCDDPPTCPYQMWVLKGDKKFLVSHPMDKPEYCWKPLNKRLTLAKCNEADAEQLWTQIP